jgi:hypothetical protein
MARSAGTVTLRFEAGTAGFVADVTKAKAAVRDFGASAKSNMVEAGATVKALQGNVAGSERAMAHFMETTLHLGPALTAAFNVVGPVLVGLAIERTAEKALKFFDDMKAAPGKIFNAFRSLSEGLHLANDELRVSNDRLANDIAQLEGRRQNTLKLALDEARLAADKLAKSLENDLELVNKQLQQQNIGKLKAFWSGSARTTDVQRYIGGDDGTGGFTGRLRSITARGEASISNAATPEAQKASRAKMDADLAAAYKEAQDWIAAEIKKAETLARPHPLAPGENPLFQNMGSDEAVRLHALRGLQGTLAEQSQFVSLQSTNTALTARKAGIEGAGAGAEGGNKDQAELIRLTDELAKAQEARLTGLEKIDAEETAEIDHLNEIGEANKANLLIVSQIYNTKRLAAYSEEMSKYDKLLGEATQQWDRLGGKAFKAVAAFDSDKIKAGKEKLEAYSKALAKVTEPLAKLIAEQDHLAIEHQSRMTSLAPGAAANPVATLKLQQAPERAAIAAQYSEQIALANQQIALAQQANDKQAGLLATLQKQRIEAERKLAVDRLDDELAEKQAETRQKGIKDFFLETQHPQTAGNIAYQGMESAQEGVSNQLAKLFTGKKTNFGEMLQGVGQDMTQNSIKSLMSTGLGAVGGLFGIKMPEGKPDGSASKPFHVISHGGEGFGGMGGAGLPEPPIPGMGQEPPELAGLLSKILPGFFAGGAVGDGGGYFETSTPVPARAAGGPVSASSAYLVGEAGPEMLTRTSGYITSNSELRRSLGGGGGHTFHTTVDARGAEIGVEHRVRRMVEQAHRSAVATAVRAGHERSMRAPQRA